MKKIAIFVPLAFPFGMVPQEFFLSFFVANEYLLSHLKEDIELQLFSPHTFPIDANRNECVAKMLEGEFDSSIWLDADQELQQDTLYRLIVEGKKYPIYAGIYYLKEHPHHPIVFRTVNRNFKTFNPIWNYPTNALFYADMIGMGCVKIDRKVFEKVDKPYFKYGKVPVELSIKNEQMAFKYRNQIDDVSEDVHFWRQVYIKTSYRIVIDPAIQIGHIRKNIVKPEEAIRFGIANKRVAVKHDGDKFLKWWDENFPKADLVNGNISVEWLFESFRQEVQTNPTS